MGRLDCDERFKFRHEAFTQCLQASAASDVKPPRFPRRPEQVRNVGL